MLLPALTGLTCCVKAPTPTTTDSPATAGVSTKAPFTLRCPVLAPFDPTQWDQVQRAFAAAPSSQFAQTWLPQHQPLFQPGTVRVGRREQTLWVFAELQDKDIYNTATELNQPTYLLGDAFEMFFHPLPQPEYYEFHVSPQNQKYQLRFAPEEAAPAGGEAARRMEEIGGKAFESWTQVLPQQHLWRVLAAMPAATVCRNGRIEAGDAWLFSFGRYDYTHGEKRPVWSSTSPHQVGDFHRQQEWGRLVFESAATPD
jgi:hypothetical protein